MDLVALEVQRSEAREVQEGPGTSPAALTAKAAATAAAAAAGGRAAGRQQQGQQLDQRCARRLDVLAAVTLAAMPVLFMQNAVHGVCTRALLCC
jgi:hypothetical protein